MEQNENGTKEFEEKLKSVLNEQYNKGIQVGAVSVSKVILEKLNDSSVPLLQRIENVKKFCNIPLKKNDNGEN